MDSAVFHRITELFRLEGNSRDHLVQSPWSKRTTYSWQPRTMSRQVMNICKDGHSTKPLGSLCDLEELILMVDIDPEEHIQFFSPRMIGGLWFI